MAILLVCTNLQLRMIIDKATLHASTCSGFQYNARFLEEKPVRERNIFDHAKSSALESGGLLPGVSMSIKHRV